jgi:hypothetical protein
MKGKGREAARNALSVIQKVHGGSLWLTIIINQSLNIFFVQQLNKLQFFF